MTKGRKPQRPKLRLIKETSHRPEPPRRPISKNIPVPPKKLSKAAESEWNLITVELEDLNVLHKVDRAILAGYCETFADFMEATYKCRTVGSVIYTATGNMVKSPWYAIKRDSLQSLIRLAAELGLSPLARTRVHAIEDDSSDENLKRFFGTAG